MTSDNRLHYRSPYLALEIAEDTPIDIIPDHASFNHWVKTFLEHYSLPNWVSMRLVSIEESAELNQTYRKKTGPTNVLSFSYLDMISIPEQADPSDMDHAIRQECPIGDIAICPAILQKEAHDFDIDITAHFAHLVIHGLLHIMGHTHDHDEDEHKMIQKERYFMKKFGLNAE